MAIGRVPGATGIQPTIVDAKGDIIAATAADSVTRLAVGSNDQRLVAASGEATGLKYVADTQNTVADAKGDLLVGTAADTIARLAVGTNDYVLTAASGETTGLKWAAPATPSFVGCSLYKTSAQSVNSGTDTAISFEAENFDTDAFHDNSTNNTRITIPSGKGGKYLFSFTMTIAANGSGVRSANLQINGSTVHQVVTMITAGAGISTRLTGTRIFSLVATDFVTLRLYQDGGTLNVNDGVTETTFSCEYLGA